MRLLPRRQAIICIYQNLNGGKQERSSTGVSSSVAGSNVSERAVSKAVPDGQKCRTEVKRKQRGRIKAGEQSRKLTQNNEAKKRLGSPLPSATSRD